MRRIATHLMGTSIAIIPNQVNIKQNIKRKSTPAKYFKNIPYLVLNSCLITILIDAARTSMESLLAD